MPFVKVQKNKAYYKRIQTKNRRRREGKTDYFARRKMVCQDKNKYNSPKFRLVVRRTNTRIITQIVFSTILGDRVLCQADSKELDRYGVPCGHTNYAACYATGLLIARRALDLVGLADSIKGVEEANAEEYHVDEEEHERDPFKVILDVGLQRTIPGSRVFGVLKGAVDGGLHIPHSIAKMPGYTEAEDKKANNFQYDAEAHLERILGNHVASHMEELQEEDPELYQTMFSKFIAAEKTNEDLEDMYKECHAAIREDPKFKKVAKADITNTRNGNEIVTSKGTKYKRMQKKSCAERKGRVAQKLKAAAKKLLAADDE